VIQFYGWILITIEHWNIVQLASYNKILGLVVLILVAIPPLTNHHLIKGIKIDYYYDISSWSLDLILDLGFNTCNIFRFGFVMYENLQCFWILEAYDNATYFEKQDMELELKLSFELLGCSTFESQLL